MAKVRLADVQCSRMQFQPGDRLLVRSWQPLDKESKRKLHRMVQRWAGEHVEILVIDAMKVEIELEQRQERLEPFDRVPQG